MRALGEQTWQGQMVRAFNDGDATLYVEHATGAWITRVRGTTPLESFDPPIGFEWPIFVGRSWVRNFRYTDHERGRSFDNVRSWYKVEAYEDVTVPAGTFKAFRVTSETGSTRTTMWFSPELGITVKLKLERSGQHYLGPGTREAELVSHDVKK